MISDDDLRDHFERQYAQGGPSADIARAVLDLFYRMDGSEMTLQALTGGELTGDKDLDKMVDDAIKLEALQAWAECDVTFKEFGDLDEETLERFARAYDGHEQQSFALQELCVEAGLLAPHDFETDPLPLIRMFLPVD